MSAENSFLEMSRFFLILKSYLRGRHPVAGRNAAALLYLLLSLVITQYGFAQTDELLRLPMQLDADSTDYDGKSSMLMFRGLRLSQGTLGISAEEGRATKMDFEDSVWQFNGDVVIDVDGGHIESDSAEMQFSGYQLRLATIVGSPATFRLTRPGSEHDTYAEAGRLKYDLQAGVIEFSDQARITEGGNQIASNFLVYNIREQRINASSGGDGEPKVRITYTPGEANVDTTDEPGEDPAPPEPDSAEEGGESGE
ncbi:MAG: LptA/OstA family protein [Woeseiaceae bacterium]